MARGAWSYLNPLPESDRIASYPSFYPELLDVSLDGHPLSAKPGQTAIAHGKDRDLGVPR